MLPEKAQTFLNKRQYKLVSSGLYSCNILALVTEYCSQHKILLRKLRMNQSLTGCCNVLELTYELLETPKNGIEPLLAILNNATQHAIHHDDFTESLRFNSKN